MTTLTLHLDDTLRAGLEALAQKSGKSPLEIIMEGIQRQIEEQENHAANAGTQVSGRRSLADLRGAAKGLHGSAEAVDAYIRAVRDEWD